MRLESQKAKAFCVRPDQLDEQIVQYTESKQDYRVEDGQKHIKCVSIIRFPSRKYYCYGNQVIDNQHSQDNDHHTKTLLEELLLLILGSLDRVPQHLKDP